VLKVIELFVSSANGSACMAAGQLMAGHQCDGLDPGVDLSSGEVHVQ
jgi:hypothetical protein